MDGAADTLLWLTNDRFVSNNKVVTHMVPA